MQARILSSCSLMLPLLAVLAKDETLAMLSFRGSDPIDGDERFKPGGRTQVMAAREGATYRRQIVDSTFFRDFQQCFQSTIGSHLDSVD